MNDLRSLVLQAWRRLMLEQFFARAVWCLTVSFAVAAVAIAVSRLFAFALLPVHGDMFTLVAALVAGLAAASVWTFFSHRTTLDAAIEIDRRFDLRERIASSLSLSEGERGTEAGQALVKDAERAASRIDIGDKFRMKFDRRSWWPIVPAIIAFVLMNFGGVPAATSSVAPNSPAAVAKQINTAAETARKTVAERRQQAERQGLKDVAGLFKKIEAAADELAKSKDVDRTQAAVKLNNLARELQQRKEQLGGNDALKKQLQNLQSFTKGPADKMAEAMQNGDLQQAAEQADKLANDLQDGKLDANSKAELAKQLDQMQKRLDEAANAHQEAKEQLSKQIAAARQQGDLAKAGDLQQKLDQLNSQSPSMNQLQQMAQQMSQAKQGLQQGNSQQASKSMQQASKQLGQMQQADQEQKMVNATLQELQQAKNSMTCPNCNGAGCEKCQGGQASKEGSSPGDSQTAGSKESSSAGGSKTASSNPSKGIGKGRGDGRSTDDALAPGATDVQVHQQPRAMTGVYAGSTPGPNRKGEVAANIQQEITGFEKSSDDPLTNDELPRNRREHAEEYFNRLREGK